MKDKVISEIIRQKMIVISRKIPSEKMIAVAQALYNGGIRLLEVTFDHKSKNGRIETCRTIEQLRTCFDGKMWIGAGTVLTLSEVLDAKNAGAEYIISPNADQEVIKETARLGMVSIPGALTPTEVVKAYTYGADFVKLFPAGELGIGYIQALLEPLGHIPMLAVGGINEKNISTFLKAGLNGVGVGSNILKSNLIANNDFSGITSLAHLYTAAIAEEEV